MKSIECKGIKKSFGGAKALQNVTLTLGSGEIRALFGGNGSGKSTLAKILGGVVYLDAGQILVDGRVVTINSPSDAEDLGIVITSQELSLFDNMSVEYNILFSILPKGKGLFLDRKSIVQKARDQLDRLGHLEIADARVSELPDNKKYIVEFAKALVQEPKLLIIDEITSALYSQEFEIVKNVIFELSKKGTLIIFISHRMNEIYQICQSVTVLRNGESIRTDPLNAINKEELLNLMTGKEEVNNGGGVHGENFLDASVIHDELDKTSRPKKHTTPPLLSFKGLLLPSFDKTVELETYPGEFVGISGLQGQGQSEFLRSLFGLVNPAVVSIDGKEVLLSSPLDAIKNGVGFISGNRQIEGVFSERSVQENLDTIHNYVLGRGSTDYNGIIDDYRIVVNDLRQPVSSLSGGNQQKVVIGRWVSIKPKILLADDPNKGVDVQARRDVHNILKDLVNSGSTVLMVSSDDEELADTARLIPNTRVIIMYNGSIIKTLREKEVTVENIISFSLSKGL